MANLRVSDRDLLVDEILNQLEKNLPSKEEEWKRISKLEKVEGLFEEYTKLQKKQDKLVKQYEEAKEEKRDFVRKTLESYDLSSYYNDDLNVLKNHLLIKHGETLPTRKQLETAILLAQGGDDMNALMVSIIEQFKNK